MISKVRRRCCLHRLSFVAPLLLLSAGVSPAQNNQVVLAALAEPITTAASLSSTASPMMQDQRKATTASAAAATASPQQQQQLWPSYHHNYDYKTKLPRLEVQLLCSHDIRQDFDVSDTFRNCYQEFFLEALSREDDEDDGDQLDSNSVRRRYSIIENDDSNPFDTELFTFVSRSTVADVKSREAFYDTCDPTSTTVLVTMDVRGYIHVKKEETTSASDERTAINVHVDGPLTAFRTHENLQRLIDQVNPTAVKDYFAEHVCTPIIAAAAAIEEEKKDVDNHHHHHPFQAIQNSSNNATTTSGSTNDTNSYSAMEYFKAKVRPWNTRLAPPPPSSARDYPYPSTKDHNHFEHNLQLLCEGGVDAVYPNYHKQVWTGPESVSSLVVGILVGMIMVGMISREWNQKRQSSIRQRRQRRRHQQQVQLTDLAGTISSAVAPSVIPTLPRTDGYEATPPNEADVV